MLITAVYPKDDNEQSATLTRIVYLFIEYWTVQITSVNKLIASKMNAESLRPCWTTFYQFIAQMQLFSSIKTSTDSFDSYKSCWKLYILFYLKGKN